MDKRRASSHRADYHARATGGAGCRAQAGGSRVIDSGAQKLYPAAACIRRPVQGGGVEQYARAAASIRAGQIRSADGLEGTGGWWPWLWGADGGTEGAGYADSAGHQRRAGPWKGAGGGGVLWELRLDFVRDSRGRVFCLLSVEVLAARLFAYS